MNFADMLGNLDNFNPAAELQKLKDDIKKDLEKVRINRILLRACAAMLEHASDEKEIAAEALRAIDIPENKIQDAINDIDWGDELERLFAMINFLAEGRSIAMHHIYKGYVVFKTRIETLSEAITTLKTNDGGTDAPNSVTGLRSETDLNACFHGNIEEYELEPGCDAFFAGILADLRELANGDELQYKLWRSQLLGTCLKIVQKVYEDVTAKIDEAAAKIDQHMRIIDMFRPLLQNVLCPAAEAETLQPLAHTPIGEEEARERITQAAKNVLKEPELATVIRFPQRCKLTKLDGEDITLIEAVMSDGLPVIEIEVGFTEGFIEIPAEVTA